MVAYFETASTQIVPGAARHGRGCPDQQAQITEARQLGNGQVLGFGRDVVFEDENPGGREQRHRRHALDGPLAFDPVARRQAGETIAVATNQQTMIRQIANRKIIRTQRPYRGRLDLGADRDLPALVNGRHIAPGAG